MKWTYDWLQDYLDTSATPQQISDMLTRIGLEVEDLSENYPPIAAKIVKCVAHPDSDHLHVLDVDDGSGKIRQVVCGAPNVREGLISALAIPGCVIQGHEIKCGKLRGVVSDGMMCSGLEIGVNNDHSGIIELDSNTVLGSPVTESIAVFDAGITPNRPDYLSVRGIAMDLAASGIGKYKKTNDLELELMSGHKNVQVKTDKCNVYRFCEIHDINIAPSNKTISSRLTSIGINPKNAPIDATNYICYDMGQPMHCFDADEIVGDITVRMATQDEEFTDLFGNKHLLRDTDIVIADEMGVLALAGVIGGDRAMTTEKTKNIILESAYFDSVSVRKSSKRLGISTDASYRYERGINPIMTSYALACAADIIMKQCGGKIVGVGMGGKNTHQQVVVKYNPSLFMKKTGIDIPAQEQKDILLKLGYNIDVCGEFWNIYPRPDRVDVVIPENIVSDLIRLYGYEKIPARKFDKSEIIAKHSDSNLIIKNKLVNRGLSENISFGFGNSAIESILIDKSIVKIANPITVEMDTARNNLLENLLLAVRDNEKRGYPDLNMFELGTIFDGDMPYEQHTGICIVRSGSTSPKHWQKRNRLVDIYDVKADVVSLMRGQKFIVSDENAPAWAHPFRYGAIYQGKKKIAEFGELHPSVAKKLRIKTNVVLAIIDNIDNLPQQSRNRGHMVINDFQPITRDFAFIVDSEFHAEKLIGTAVSVSNIITKATVFDSFEMGDGKKSIAFTITINPTDNMSEDMLMKLQNDIINTVEKKCNAKIRDR